MRASVVLAKLKMRRFVIRNAVSDSVAVSVRELFVFSKGAIVDIYFPADTAVVSAFSKFISSSALPSINWAMFSGILK